MSKVPQAKYVQDMIDGKERYYYSGGQFGRTLLYLDVDAHEEWQDDADELTKKVMDLFGDDSCFIVKSSRGMNIFVKWEYLKAENVTIFGVASRRKANETIADLEKALKRHTRSFKSHDRIKGKITLSHDHYGTLAKLPVFGGSWTEERLQKFDSLSVVDNEFIRGLISTLNNSNPNHRHRSRKTRHRAGSCDSFTISGRDEERIPAWLHEVRETSWHLANNACKAKRAGTKVTSRDFAIAQVVLGLAGKCRKIRFGHQMPTAYVAAIWPSCFKTGWVDRGFDSSRFAAIRNTMADHGMIDLVSQKYWFDRQQRGEGEGDGMELESPF